jgi:hypothetical protein
VTGNGSRVESRKRVQAPAVSSWRTW